MMTVIKMEMSNKLIKDNAIIPNDIWKADIVVYKEFAKYALS